MGFTETRANRPFQGVVRGRWLFTGERLLPRGGVLISGGRVAAVLTGRDPDPPGVEVMDLPGALLHPGLLDAHAHLDLTDLLGRIPPGLPFPRWLAAVRTLRAEAGPGGLLEAARRGIALLVESGAAGIVDYSYGGRSEEPLRASGVRAVVLREVIGPDEERALEAEREAGEWLAARPDDGLMTYGLAPHSPYLATGALIAALRRMALGRPFSIHAAELAGEGRLLREGSGELADFLAEVTGVRPPPRGAGPIELLERLDVLRGTLVVHAACLEPGDLARLSAGGAAVAFCPGTHAYFDRGPHPFLELLAAGVPVALGTDSAASNACLSMAHEMRELRRQFPVLPAATVLQIAAGAHLARSPGPFGRLASSLEPGRSADLAAAELPTGGGDPLEAFLREAGPNHLTISAGRVLFERSSG